MNKNQQFKETVLKWIQEELNKNEPMVVTLLAEDPLNKVTLPRDEDDIIELTEADMIIEKPAYILFKCDKCLFTAAIKRELLENEYRMFCPRCDNTLFDEELKK